MQVEEGEFNTDRISQIWSQVQVDARPNGLAFSCRERAGSSLSKPNDLAREAVNCNAGLGAHGTDFERNSSLYTRNVAAKALSYDSTGVYLSRSSTCAGLVTSRMYKPWS
jgi:hypothetical protein